eukprot:307244-Rhodomonas_salina.1
MQLPVCHWQCVDSHRDSDGPLTVTRTGPITATARRDPAPARGPGLPVDLKTPSPGSSGHGPG